MIGAMQTHEDGFHCRTARLERFQEIIGNVVRPARVHAEGAGRHDFHVDHVRFAQLEFTVLRYGDPLEVELPGVGSNAQQSLVLQLMLTGSAHTSVDGGRPLEQTPTSAHLAASHLPLRVRCHRDCRHFLVRMDRSVLERAADDFRQVIDWPDPRTALSLDTRGGRSLRRYVRYLVGELDAGRRSDLRGGVARAAEQSLLAHVLVALDARAALRKGSTSPSPRAEALEAAVLRATDFIEAHLQDEIGLREIMANSGSSLRTLYRAFERLHGTSPMAYVRGRRLERAHAELLAADPGLVRVTDVALRWGFAHLSDFASHYRDRYGCLPSQTLRRH